MPFFHVSIHGTGVRFTPDDSSTVIVGFYTSRGVRAVSAQEAVEKAKRSVLRLWATKEYVAANKGGPPLLSTDTVEQVSFWHAWKIPNRGHTFYAEDDSNRNEGKE